MDVISTAEVPAHERFAFWREVSDTLWVPYDLRCEPELRSRFRARAGVSGFGQVQATLLTTSPHVVQRTARLIRRTDPEVFKLCRLIRGSAFVEQDDRQTELRAGDLVLFDTSRPFLGRHSPGCRASRLLILQFPRSLLPLPAQQVRRLSGARIAGDRLAGALETQHTVPAEAHRRALMTRIHAFIRANLGDPSLGPHTIAAAHAGWSGAGATSPTPGRRSSRSPLSPPGGDSAAPRISATRSAPPTVVPRARSATGGTSRYCDQAW